MIDGEMVCNVSDVMPRNEKRLREPCYLVCSAWVGHLPLMLLHEAIDSHGHSWGFVPHALVPRLLNTPWCL